MNGISSAYGEKRNIEEVQFQTAWNMTTEDILWECVIRRMNVRCIWHVVYMEGLELEMWTN
jgi:hypothetical protein